MVLKVLHIGFGFTPWRGGGLIEHAEDLMEEQVAHGYHVAYFCSGRHYPLFKRTLLNKWRRNGYQIYEVINPTIYHGGDRGTFDDINNSVLEKLFLDTLKEFQPDIVHIQELAGLPSSIIDVCKVLNVPVIMSLQDYFLLCPTLKLFDYKYENCHEDWIGDKCILCFSGTPESIKQSLIRNTIRFELKRLIKIKSIKTLMKKIIWYAKLTSHKSKAEVSIGANDTIEYFQRRRETNIERLRKVNLLIAQSKRVEEIYSRFLNSCNIKTITMTVKHLENIYPKKIVLDSSPIRFFTLNGFATRQKGGYLLLEALKILSNSGIDSQFELHAYGGILPEIELEIRKLSNVFYHGAYSVDDLDHILEKADVGIVPSIWEECLGYVGLEFLAKGVPVLGNKRGGIVEYTIDGLTGWLVGNPTQDNLANLMRSIVNDPSQIEKRNQYILAYYKSIIKTMEQNFYEFEEEYLRLLR